MCCALSLGEGSVERSTDVEGGVWLDINGQCEGSEAVSDVDPQLCEIFVANSALQLKIAYSRE